MSIKISGIVFIIFLTIAVLQGCTQPVETNVAKNTNTNQSVQSSNINTVVNTAGNSEANRNIVTNTNPALTANTKTATQTSESTARTTVGASDLAMFMQIRRKLNTDKDLINSVIVDIKGGNAILTGNVSNDVQKKKAEDIAKSVEGVKSVKNNLKVGQ